MTTPNTDDARLRVQIGEASAALLRLNTADPDTAGGLVALIRVIADEAARTPRFAKALATVLAPEGARSETVVAHPPAAPRKAPVRRGKRAPGPFDPFAVYRDSGESGLRDALGALDVEPLKDIIAEHAMDYDKLAMRWRTASKLRERIVERVKALTTKGDVFR